MSNFKKYRKLPVEISAIYNDGSIETFEEVSYEHDGPIERYDDGSIAVETLEGVMKANVGDYIIKGVNGEIYPCKPDIFEKTYEEVMH